MGQNAVLKSCRAATEDRPRQQFPTQTSMKPIFLRGHVSACFGVCVCLVLRIGRGDHYMELEKRPATPHGIRYFSLVPMPPRLNRRNQYPLSHPRGFPAGGESVWMNPCPLLQWTLNLCRNLGGEVSLLPFGILAARDPVSVPRLPSRL